MKKNTQKSILIFLSILAILPIFFPIAIAKASSVYEIISHEDLYWIDWDHDINMNFTNFGPDIDMSNHINSEAFTATSQERGPILVVKFGKVLKGGLRALIVGGRTIKPVANHVAVNNVSRNFVQRATTIGGHRINMTASNVVHVLQRHHQNFWLGRGRKPTLFARSTTANGVRDIAYHVLSQPQNAAAIRRLTRAQMAMNKNRAFTARINGHNFRVVINRGIVVTAYPIR